MNEDQIKSELEKYDAWELDEDSGKIASGFEFENFLEAVDFASKIADVAEEVGHHPDILIHDYKYLTVFVGTHDVAGITEKDFEFVKAFEENLSESEADFEDIAE